MGALEKQPSAQSPDKILGSTSLENRVSQPARLKEQLSQDLGMFLEGINQVSETSATGPSNQWSDDTGQAQTSGGSKTATRSSREEAIATIPAPALMQKKLEKHIQQEVKTLRKQAKQIARIGKPGSAYKLNQLYTRIRLLNALLAEVLEASADALKRLFIKVFIDRQTIL